MSCGGEKQYFRLLDGYVGWDEENCQGLTGLAFDDANGLTLAQEHSPKDCTAGDPFISVRDILQYIPPPQLAHGCEHCDWFLVYKNRLLHHDCCLPGWRSAWSKKCNQHKLKGAGAVAARGHHVAVSDRKAKRIWIWTGDGEQLIASIDAKNLAGIPECDPHHVNKIDELGHLRSHHGMNCWSLILKVIPSGGSAFPENCMGCYRWPCPRKPLPDESIAWRLAMTVRFG